MIYGSSIDMWDLSEKYGEHYGTSMNPISAWSGEINMWKHPNTYDVLYNVTFHYPQHLSKLTLTYDAGATVLIQSLDGKTTYGSKSCYETNGGNINECLLELSVGPIDGVQVVIDSRAGTWNWMGNYKLWGRDNQKLVYKTHQGEL